MGRKSVNGKKVHVGCRVEPHIQAAINKIGAANFWKPSQTLEILVKESPRLKAELRKNGKKV